MTNPLTSSHRHNFSPKCDFEKSGPLRAPLGTLRNTMNIFPVQNINPPSLYPCQTEATQNSTF